MKLDNTRSILTAIGFATSIATNYFLYTGWSQWKEGPWADCSNYAFSEHWYAVPPLPVTLVPFLFAIVGIAVCLSSVRPLRGNRSLGYSVVNVLVLVMNFAPILGACVLPAVSDSLNLTQAGC